MKFLFTFFSSNGNTDYSWDADEGILSFNGKEKILKKDTDKGRLMLDFMEKGKFVSPDYEKRRPFQRQLHKLLEDLELVAYGPDVVETVRGMGYRWKLKVKTEPLSNPNQRGSDPDGPERHALAHFQVSNAGLISNKTRDFVGRNFVFEALDAFCRENDRGYFIVEGDPGVGKTSLMAMLAHDRKYPHHFNSRGNQDSVRSFMTNLCAQLIIRYDLPERVFPPGFDQDSQFLDTVLAQVSQSVSADQPCIILVDALDEAVEKRPGGNVLYLPRSLPAHIYFMLTTRRFEAPILRVEPPARTLKIVDDELNRADLAKYVKLNLGKPGITEYREKMNYNISAFVEELVSSSQGNFMYLYYVLPEVGQGAFHDRKLTKLPQGLVAYYEDHWDRMKLRGNLDWHKVKLPVIYQLSVVYDPVTCRRISEYTALPGSQVADTLSEWAQFIHEQQRRGEKTYLIYHPSYSDFLQAKDQVRAIGEDLENQRNKDANSTLTPFIRQAKSNMADKDLRHLENEGMFF